MNSKPIILLPSKTMKVKNEDFILRLPSATRKFLNLKVRSIVEIYRGTTTLQRIKTQKALEIKLAFKKDLRLLKKLILNNKISIDDITKVVFVTPNTINKIKDLKNIFILNSSNPLIIGADPEFILKNTDGTIVKANHLHSNIFNKKTNLGYDGPMAELRPNPTSHPERLVQNILNLLTSNSGKYIEKYSWKSACYIHDAFRDYPVGFHIHIGTPIIVKHILTDKQLRNLFIIINKILDELITIPMIRLDGDLGWNRRAHCKMSPGGNFGTKYGKGYGWFGEYRVVDDRLEFRSLSGKALSHPELTEAVYGTVQCIVESIYEVLLNSSLNDIKKRLTDFSKIEVFSNNFKKWDAIPIVGDFGCTKSTKTMNTLMNESSREIINIQYLHEWYEHIKTISKFNKYAHYINTLYEILKRNSKILDNINTNIQETWLYNKPIFK